MTNEIEDKIKEYLVRRDSNKPIMYVSDMAHDIAEIAKKELTPNIVMRMVDELEKENTVHESLIIAMERHIEVDEAEHDAIIKENTEMKERFMADECDFCNVLRDENEELKSKILELEKEG